MAEYLDLDGGALADEFDLIPGQLPGQHHPAGPQVGAPLYPVQRVDGHLGGGVDGQVGDRLAQHAHHAQVLDDDRIHADGAGVGRHFGGSGQLPVGEQGVQGQMDLAAPEMAIRNRRRSFLL